MQFVAIYAKNGLMGNEPKALGWVGSSRQDLGDFPKKVRQSVGYALYLAQCGEKAAFVKPLKGFAGASVLEVIEDLDGDTYRAVYTVKFAESVYVLHCFQKKSKSGIATPKLEIDKVKARLKLAQDRHNLWLRELKKKQ